MSDRRVIQLAQHPHRARTDPGGALRAARQQAGLSLPDFAAALAIPGVGPDAIRAFEDGHARRPQSVIDAASRLPEPHTHNQPSVPASAEDTDDAELAARSLIHHTDAASAPRTAIDLGRNDMRRRDAILKASYGIAALCIPSRDWLLSALERATTPRPRIGMSEIEGMRSIFAAFQEMDVRGGGGDRARTALVGYFNDRVAPLLDQQHKPAVRRALFQAASEQTYLAGWMAYEAANHGLAERYLIQSLRLAQESGDVLLGAHVLAGMSDQATLLGHPHEGLKLAKAAQHGLRRQPPCAALADLHTLEARAHATLGHKRACLATIRRLRPPSTRSTPTTNRSGRDSSTCPTCGASSPTAPETYNSPNSPRPSHTNQSPKARASDAPGAAR